MKSIVLVLICVIACFLVHPVNVSADADCTISKTMKCTFITGEYVVVNEKSITVYSSSGKSLTSATFKSIVSLTQDLSKAGDVLVRSGQLDKGGSLVDFKEAATKTGSYGALAKRILDDGNLILATNAPQKAGIYLLGNLIGDTPEFQVNIGPSEDGTVQVLTLALFMRPVFWDTFSYNVYAK